MSDIHALVAKLSPREQFKFAFLEKCAEQGLSADEMLLQAETALTRAKQAFDDPLENIKNVLTLGGLGAGFHAANKAMGGWLPAAMIGTPLIGGALIGNRLGKVHDSVLTPSVGEIQQNELIAEYNRQADRLRREKQVKDYRASDTGKGGRPML